MCQCDGGSGSNSAGPGTGFVSGASVHPLGVKWDSCETGCCTCWHMPGLAKGVNDMGDSSGGGGSVTSWVLEGAAMLKRNAPWLVTDASLSQETCKGKGMSELEGSNRCWNIMSVQGSGRESDNVMSCMSGTPQWAVCMEETRS